MATRYTKSLTSDLSGTLDTTQLCDEINESSIGPECYVVLNRADDVIIDFDSSLSTGEQTTLDTLVSNHVPIVRTYEKPFPKIEHIFDTFLKIIPSNTPQVLSYHHYYGSGTTQDPENNGSVIYSGNIDFVLRDVKNNIDIMTLSTTGAQSGIPLSAAIPTLENLPVDEAILQLSCKLTDGTVGKIYSLRLD